MKAHAAIVVLLAACDPPSPPLTLHLDDGPVGLCPSNDCADVRMSCQMFESIRFVDPSDPKSPFLSQCEAVPVNGSKDLCAVARIDVEKKELPLQNLEVQIALFPESMVTIDPMTGEPICPADTQYDAATGYPVASDFSPAVGGRAYYHPGDEQIEVTLACPDVSVLDLPSCRGTAGSTRVTAIVNDFDFPSPHTGDISVSIGEPVSNDPFYLLGTNQLDMLTQTVGPSGQQWVANLDKSFTVYPCVAVRDDAPESTTTIVCRRTPGGEKNFSWPQSPAAGEIDDETHTGAAVWLPKTLLDQMLAGLSLTTFPTHGLTIGVVLDSSGLPVANQAVTASAGSIVYFSTDLTGIGGTRTSMNGMFASTDARFGTIFSATSTTPLKTVARIGGRVDGKVTIVVLQFSGGGVGG